MYQSLPPRKHAAPGDCVGGSPHGCGRERGEDTDLDNRLRVCAGCDYQKAPERRPKPLHNFTDFKFDLFERMLMNQPLSNCETNVSHGTLSNQLSLFDY